jgi:hypothetical protein
MPVDFLKLQYNACMQFESSIYSFKIGKCVAEIKVKPNVQTRCLVLVCLTELNQT